MVVAQYDLQVADNHLAKAVPWHAVSAPTNSQTEWRAHEKTPVLQGSANECDSLPESQVGVRGLEPSAFSSEKTAIPQTGGAESGAVGARNSPIDSRLRAVIEAWPTLPDAVKAGILAIVEAATDGREQ